MWRNLIVLVSPHFWRNSLLPWGNVVSCSNHEHHQTVCWCQVQEHCYSLHIHYLQNCTVVVLPEPRIYLEFHQLCQSLGHKCLTLHHTQKTMHSERTHHTLHSMGIRHHKPEGAQSRSMKLPRKSRYWWEEFDMLSIIQPSEPLAYSHKRCCSPRACIFWIDYRVPYQH